MNSSLPSVAHTYSMMICWRLFTLNYMHAVLLLQWNTNLQLDNNFIRFQTRSDALPCFPFLPSPRPCLFLPDDVTALNCPLGASYLGYLRKYRGNFATATRNRLLTLSSSLPSSLPPSADFFSGWLASMLSAGCGSRTEDTCFSARTHLSFLRGRLRWWRCCWCRALAECSSGPASAPL